MTEELEERLTKKGWPKADIKKTIKIINRAKQEKSKTIKIIDAIVYWFVLFVAIIGNFIISIILVPFLVVFGYARLYIVVITLGAAFGILFNILLKDIENLERRHHIIIGMFLPALTLINVVYMVNFANFLSDTIGIANTQHNPFVIGAMYTISFIAPYLIYSTTRLSKK